ncbi:MAG: hypothetical protein NTW06_02900 [Candidatus Falkowbacteria bacterium]|jgi:uncharacterized membrane protein|nr:hypothetical protein [Candidatus Falkowbacteria bacterium]
MQKKDFFIKFLAYFCLVVGSIFLLASLVTSIIAWIYFSSSSVPKKIMLDLALIIMGVVGFLVGVGLFQYLNSFIKIEKEVEKIEEEIEEIEQKKQ